MEKRSACILKSILNIMKKNICLVIFVCFFAHEVNSQIVIQDSVFNATLDLNGASWNNAIIKNCIFSSFILSDGLRIANANNVLIDSCSFYNIQGNGIRLHNSGVSNNVIIRNCSFDSIYGNGILSSEGHSNTQILNNTFNNIGLDTTASAAGQPHHGIYFQGNKFLISGNIISNIYNNDGNCISVRSNGVVRSNVLYNAEKNGISYYSDHPNVERLLLIENNIIYHCKRGVSVVNGGEHYVDTTIIRFNTIITNNLMCISIGAGLTMSNLIYGNILIREDGNPIHIWAESSYDSAKNVLVSGDIGFVDYFNHNYHITDQSVAYAYATGLLDYPLFDFENDPRGAFRLDAGADQDESMSLVHSVIISDNLAFPNPVIEKMNLVVDDLFYEVQILNYMGQIVVSMPNIKSIDVSMLPGGAYLLIIKSNKTVRAQKIIVY